MFFPSNNYSFCDTSIELLPSNHLLAAERTEGCRSYVHWALGNLEAIPYLGRAVAYLDLLIAKVIDFFCNCFCSPKEGSALEEGDEKKELVEEPSLKNLLALFPQKSRDWLQGEVENSRLTKMLELDLSHDFSDEAIKAIITNLGGILDDDVGCCIELSPNHLFLLNPQLTGKIKSLDILIEANTPDAFRLLNEYTNKFKINHHLTINANYRSLDNGTWDALEDAFSKFLLEFRGKKHLELKILHLTPRIANCINTYMNRNDYDATKFGLELKSPGKGTLKILSEEIDIYFLVVTIEQPNFDDINTIIERQGLTHLNIYFTNPDAPPTEEIKQLSHLDQSVELSFFLENDNYEIPTDLFDILQYHNVISISIDRPTVAQCNQLCSLFPNANIEYEEYAPE